MNPWGGHLKSMKQNAVVASMLLSEAVSSRIASIPFDLSQEI